MNIQLDKEIAPMFHDTFNSKVMHQVLKGGRGSTKTGRNKLKIPMTILENPGTNVVVLRRYAVDNRKSTYKELKKGFKMLGVKLRNKKELSYSPLMIRYKKSEIYFAGMEDYESVKGMIPEENEINILWFFEISQFKNEYDMQQIIATFTRGNPKFFICIYEYNPHPNLSHWTYEWVKKMEKREDAFVSHTTYLDLPKKLQDEWLGKYFIKEAEAIKELDYEQYKSIYLGLPARLKGAIYKRFKMDKYNKELVYDSLFYTIGVDYGETDATTFCHTGFGRHMNSVKSYDEYYHKNSGESQKDINDYCNDFFKFAAECHDKHGKPMIVYVDSASKSFRMIITNEAARRRIGYLDIRAVNKRKKKEKSSTAIQERINTTNLMLGVDNYLQIDKSCIKLLLALETCEYNSKGERIDDGSYNIDSMDAFEYSWLEHLTDIEEGILNLKGVKR